MTIHHYTKILIALLLLLVVPTGMTAQETAEVHASYTYTVGDNDNISLRDAKRKCIELAKAEAIKEKFGELITSDVIESNEETNGEASSSFFWENTVAMARGDWLGDTKEPAISVEYIDGKLSFTAEVWGEAREIIQAKADLKWKLMKDGVDERIETSIYNQGERIYLTFRAPADGYVAVYLIVGDDETSCLLPYPRDTSGRYMVKGGRDYLFFDKAVELSAVNYRMTTKRAVEDNQLVVIYSPNPFMKCNDITGDARHPNSLSTRDFQKWLLKCQRADRDMVVDKRWVKIHNAAAE